MLLFGLLSVWESMLEPKCILFMRWVFLVDTDDTDECSEMYTVVFMNGYKYIQNIPLLTDGPKGCLYIIPVDYMVISNVKTVSLFEN